VPRWDYVILDEAHRLKNKEGKALGALQSLHVGCKLALTGTPLQNNVGELWTMLDMLEPGAFGSQESFNESFGDMRSAEEAQLLVEKLRPHLLRRTKEDVNLGIMPMEETLISVEITNFQKQTYRALLEQNRALLLHGHAGISGPSFNNLSMQLRHCCNHPFLIKGVREAEGIDLMDERMYLECLVSSSGKLVLLDKLLPKLQAQGHRVLLFSQFTMLLDLLEDYVRLRGYSYERLDGGIVGDKRQAAIDRFSDPSSNTFLFLLGTRAGGVGINLTAADTVIIYDPDWNPQNDVQAQARCHRIGQKKTVSVYRLVTRGTYEENLSIRANQKRGLEQAVIGHGDYTAKATEQVESSATAKVRKAKEIEALLKRGAHQLFTDEHDKLVEEFKSESIDQILSRSLTHRTEGEDVSTASKKESSSLFATAKFSVAGENGEETLDMEDPEFWVKVLGEEAPAAAEEEFDIYDEFGLRRRSRRSTAEPQRLAPSWDQFQSSSKEKNAKKDAKEDDSWTRAQLQGLYSGLSAFGFGRPQAVRDRAPALYERSLDEVEFALEYTVHQALVHSFAEEGEQSSEGETRSTDFEAVARAWHFLQTGFPLTPGEELHHPPSHVHTINMGANSWYDSRIVAKADPLTALLIDLRRLRTAVEMTPNFRAPKVPVRYACPVISTLDANGQCVDTEKGWGEDEDTDLLRGVYKHGYGSLELVFADESLEHLRSLELRSYSSTGNGVSAKAVEMPSAVQNSEEASLRQSDNQASQESDSQCGKPSTPVAHGSMRRVVESRAITRRLKSLLNHLPITKQGHLETCETENENDDNMRDSKTAVDMDAKAFVLGLYPKDYDRSRPSELLSLDDNGMPYMREKGLSRSANSDSKAAKQATSEARMAERAAKNEASARERQERENTRIHNIISKLLDDMMNKVARLHVRWMKSEEKAEAERQRVAELNEKRKEREKAALEREREIEEQRCKRQAEKQRRAEERERDKSMRHMLKVRAAQARRVVLVQLLTSKKDTTEDTNARDICASVLEKQQADANRTRRSSSVARDKSAVLNSDGELIEAAPGIRVELHLSLSGQVMGATKLKDGIDKLMNSYDWTNKSEVFKKGHPWMSLMDSIQVGLQQNIGEQYAVRSSMGCGGWAKVPWIAVSHPCESTQAGLYLQYLFRADMSAVYLCLGQGISKIKAAFGVHKSKEHLATIGNFVRSKCRELADAGDPFEELDLSGDIDLRGQGGLAGDYERGCIVSIRYDLNEVPEESTLLNHLHQMLDIYAAVLVDEDYIDIKSRSDEEVAQALPFDARKRKRVSTSPAPPTKRRERVKYTEVAPGDPDSEAESMQEGNGVDAEDTTPPSRSSISDAGVSSAACAKSVSKKDALPASESSASCPSAQSEKKAPLPAVGSPGRSHGKSKVDERPALVSTDRKDAKPKLDKRSAQGKMMRTWPVGMRVEVMQTDEGFYGAWFLGSVKGYKADRVIVEYDEFLEECDEEESADTPHLRQEELQENMRPVPPQVESHELWASGLNEGDVCQLNFESGWWDVRILEVRPEAEKKFLVKPLLYNIEHSVNADVLRPKTVWVWNAVSKEWRPKGN